MVQCFYTVCKIDKNGNHSPSCPTVTGKYPPTDYGETPISFHQWQPSQREYFAAYAMQGILSAVFGNIDALKGIHDAAKENDERSREFISGLAYKYADAMIEASNE